MTDPKITPKATAETAEGITDVSNLGDSNSRPVSRPWWTRFFPFFLSAAFYLVAVLAVFSPLPLVFLRIKSGRTWALLAMVTNSVIVGLLGGEASLIFYLTYIVSLSLIMGELLSLGKSIEKTAGFSLMIIAITGLGFLLAYARIHHVAPITEARNDISMLMNTVSQVLSRDLKQTDSADVPALGSDEWKQNLLLELPSAVAIFGLVLVWANLIVVLKANPNGIREKLGLDPRFTSKWKAPEFLVWPTIACGFFLLKDMGKASDMALNLFKFLMAIYVIQGLSVLASFFDSWNLKGFFRKLGFLAAVFLMLPLVLSLGFFDLWFDFRGKLRQS